MSEKKTYSNLSLAEQKTLLEIQQLKKPWWKKSNYLGLMATSSLGLLTIFLTFFTRLIDDKLVNYENQMEAIQFEKDSIHANLITYTDSIKLAQTELDSIQQVVSLKDSNLMVEAEKRKYHEAYIDSTENAFNDRIKDAESVEEKLEIALKENAALRKKIVNSQKRMAVLSLNFTDSISTMRSTYKELSKKFKLYKLRSYEITPEEYDLILANRKNDMIGQQRIQQQIDLQGINQQQTGQ